MDVHAAIAEERRRVADLLEGFTPDQWAAKSCCGGWTTADIAGHMLAGPMKGLLGSLPFLLRAGGRPNKTNDLTAKELAKMGPEKLVAELRANAENRFVPPGFPQEAPLVDVIIHGQDIVRPLGLALDVPVECWQPALESATSARYSLVNVRRKLKGLSFQSTNSSFSWGDGPQVSGASQDLAHAMWGRAAALDMLEGDGVEPLRQRLS